MRGKRERTNSWLLVLVMAVVVMFGLVPSLAVAADGDGGASLAPGAVAAQEANPVAGISLAREGGFEFVENESGYWDEDGYWDDDDNWVKTGDWFRYSVSFQEGDVLTVEWSEEGKEPTDYTYSWDEDGDCWAFVAEDGSVIGEGEVALYDNQSESHWTVGGDNAFTVSYMGETRDVAVAVKANPVAGISLAREGGFEFVENSNGSPEEDGYWDDDDNWVKTGDWFRYYLPGFQEGDVLTVEWSEEGKEPTDYTYGELYDEDEECYYYAFVADDGEVIKGDEVALYDNQSESHWTVGGDNSFTISYMGVEGTVPVSVAANPVAGISLAREGGFEFVENSNGSPEEDGYWDDDDNWVKTGDWFRYSVSFQEGDVLTVEWSEEGKEPTDYTYSWDEDGDCWAFVAEDGSVIGEGEVALYDNQSESHWTVGGDNSFTISYMGVEGTVPVSVAANPVAGISLAREGGFVFVENANGSPEEDGYYDDDDNWVKTGDWFRYYLPGFQEGDVLTVTWSDETREPTAYTYGELYDEDEECYYYAFVADDDEVIDSENVSLDDSQYDSHWVVGTNYMTVSYGGRSSQVPVTVVPNPVHHITYSFGEPLVEGIDGSWTSEAWDEDDNLVEIEEEWFEYDLMREGNMLTVYASEDDDNPAIYVYGLYGDEEDQYWGYVNQDDSEDVISEGEVRISSNQSWQSSWQAGNAYDVEVSYMGSTCTASIATVGFAAGLGEVDALALGEPVSVNTDYDGVYYSFTPEEDGWYRFYSYSAIGSPRGLLYRENGRQLVRDDDSGGNNSFPLLFELEAGTTYYLKAATWSYTSSYQLKVEQVKVPTYISATLIDGSVLTYGDTSQGSLSYYYGEEDEEFEYFRFYDSTILDMLKVTATYADGSTEPVSASDLALVGYDCTDWVAGNSYQVTVELAGVRGLVEIPTRANPVAEIAFEPVAPYELIEEVDGYWGGNGRFYYYAPEFKDGDKLTVTWYKETADQTVYTYDVHENEFFAEGFDPIDADDVQRSYNSASWVVGDNVMTLEYMSIKCQVNIKIVANPVASIAYERSESAVLYDHVDGQNAYDGDGNKWFRYYISVAAGDKLTVKWVEEGKDDTTYVYDPATTGTYAFVNETDPNDTVAIYESSSARRNINMGSNQSFENQLSLGVNENAGRVTFMNHEASFSVKIVSNPVASIAYERAADATELIEGADGSTQSGYYDEVTEEWVECGPWFRYYGYPAVGDRLTVNWAEGGSTTYVAQPLYENPGYYTIEALFVNENDPTDTFHSSMVLFSDDQSPDHPWEAGPHTVTVTYMNRPAEITLTVVESTVKSISFDPASPFVIGISEDESYTETEGGTPWTYYYVNNRGFMTGDKLTVTYEDGPQVEFTCDGGGIFRDVNGDPLFTVSTRAPRLSNNQSAANQWSVGCDNARMVVSFMGATCKVPVEVVEAIDIAKNPEVSFTPSSVELAYNGEIQMPAVTGTYGSETLVAGRDFYTYTDGSPKEIGTYRMYIEGMGRFKGYRTLQFQIVDAPAEVIAAPSAVEGLVYSGAAQTGVPAGEHYTIDGNTKTAAGNYAAIVTADEGYIFQGGKTITVRWSIAPKGVTVTAADASKTYGAAEPELTATVDGLVEGEAESLISYTLTRVAGEDVLEGGYDIQASGSSVQGNYAVTFVNGKFTINPLAVAVGITGHTATIEYDGAEHAVSGYDISIPEGSGLSEDDIAYSGGVPEAKGTASGRYDMGLDASKFSIVGEKAGNYAATFSVVDGYILISESSDPVPVGISFSPEIPYNLLANVDGEWKDDGQGGQWFCYDAPTFEDYDAITVKWSDGTEKTYEYDSDSEAFILDGDSIPAGDIIRSDGQSAESRWEVGHAYYITVGYLGMTCQVPVAVVNFTDIIEVEGELQLGQTIEVTTYKAEQYFSFTPAATGQYRFYSSDTTGDPVACLYESNGVKLAEVDDSAGDRNFSITHELEGGKTYYLFVTAYTQNTKFNLTVEKDGGSAPSISAVLKEGAALVYENDLQGYWGVSASGERYLQYSDWAVLDLFEVTATYEDGATGTVSSNDLSLEPFDSSTWEPGRSYSVTIKYGDLSCVALVPVVANPVASISYGLANPIVLTVGEGLQKGYYPGDDGEMVEYSYYEFIIHHQGDKLTVNWADSQKEPTVYTFDEQQWAFLDQGGNQFEGSLAYEDYQPRIPWKIGNDNYFGLNYLGRSCKVYVTIVPRATTISASDKSVAMGKTVGIGATASSGAAVTYKSSNTAVAKVNATTGVVTPVKAGTATVTVSAAAKGDYAAATKAVKVTVTPGTQSLTFKKQTKKVGLAKVKKAKQTVAITKAKGAKTTVTYKKVKVNKKAANFTVNKKTGKITVKKGTPKGTYKVTVKATAAKTADWKVANKTAVITIIVK